MDERAVWRFLCAVRQMQSALQVARALRPSVQALDIDTQSKLLHAIEADPVLGTCPLPRDYMRKIYKQLMLMASDDKQEVSEVLIERYPELVAAHDAEKAEVAGNAVPWRLKTWAFSRASALLAVAADGGGGGGGGDFVADQLELGRVTREHSRRVGRVLSAVDGLQASGLDVSAFAPGTTRSPPPAVGLVSLRVSDNLFAGGTGCHEWEAGFALAEYVLSCPGSFAGRACIELGCGSGLVGICLALAGASSVTLTDCDPDTLVNCRLNLQLNGVPVAAAGSAAESGSPRTPYVSGCDGEEGVGSGLQVTAPVRVSHLDWSHTEALDELGRQDVVLGADVLYDPEIVPLLVAVVKCALAAGGGGRRVSTSSPPGNGPQQLATTTTSVAYIATKVRNEATLELFLTTCSTSGLVVEDITSAAVAATSVGVRFLHNSVLPNDDVRFAVVLHRITLS